VKILTQTFGNLIKTYPMQCYEGRDSIVWMHVSFDVQSMMLVTRCLKADGELEIWYTEIWYTEEGVTTAVPIGRVAEGLYEDATTRIKYTVSDEEIH
jgi:hypothetical protein